MATLTPLQIRLSPELRASAQARADADGVSVAEAIRVILEAALTAPCRRCKGTGIEQSR